MQKVPLARHATLRVRSLLRKRPAVALLGPRQAGKTTHAKTMAGLDKVAAWVDVDLRVLISRTSEVIESDDRISCSLSAFLERTKQRLP